MLQLTDAYQSGPFYLYVDIFINFVMFVTLITHILMFIRITWCKGTLTTKVLCSQDINFKILSFICTFVIGKYNRVISKAFKDKSSRILPCAHPCFQPKLSIKKIFHFNFLIQLFLFRNKTDYHIPEYYFAYGYHYCFLVILITHMHN